MPLRVTSPLLVEERLFEASCFADRMSEQRGGDELGYNLNAFLSASRAVTFLLQGEMRHVGGFQEWWLARQDARRSSDEVLPSVTKLSQKEGRVAIDSIGSSLEPDSWRHQFVDAQTAVPSEVRQIDAVDAWHMHLVKIAKIVLACMDGFPIRPAPCGRLLQKA